MFTLLSRRKRSLRRIAALVLVTGWLAPIAVPHAADDDQACVVRLEGDGSASLLSAAGAQQQPDHCLVCHAARSFRSAQPETARIVVRLSPGFFVELSAGGFRRTAAHDRLPARAPPNVIQLLVPNR